MEDCTMVHVTDTAAIQMAIYSKKMKSQLRTACFGILLGIYLRLKKKDCFSGYFLKKTDEAGRFFCVMKPFFFFFFEQN